jgi:hypothetical protein
MKMKPHEKSLGCNPLSDTPYQNLGMMLNGQGLGHHPLGDAPYLDLDTVLNVFWLMWFQSLAYTNLLE